MIRLSLILSISTLSVIAQPAKRDLQFNLNFESVAGENYSPASWKKHGEGHTVKIDFSEKYEGKASLMIKSKENRLEKDSIALVANSMELIYRGKMIQLSGYLKLDNVDGRAGLCLIINGKNGPIAAEEMKNINLHGTKSWNKYSIKLPLPDSAISIYFGVYQTGNGRLWADKLELLVDNKNISISEAKAENPNISTVEIDTMSSKAETFSSKFGKIITSDPLLNDSVSHVSIVPVAFRFNSFYKKYLNAAGLSVIGSENISDEAFYKTREVLLMMLKKIPAIKTKLIDNNVRIAIIGRGEDLTDLPEYNNLDKSINRRARGLGGTIELPMTSCAEENILCLNNDRYNGEDILIHEFAHTMHMMGISFIDQDFNNKLKSIYLQALNEELWKNTYAISSPEEYFAEGVQSWFNVNKQEKVANGIHNDVDTRAKLKLYDRRLHDLISMYFSDDQKNVSCHQQKKISRDWIPWNTNE